MDKDESGSAPLRIAGATGEETRLGPGRTALWLPIDAPDQSLLVPLGGGGVFLKFEGAAGPPAEFEIYLNLPEGEDPAGHRNRFAGTLTLPGPTPMLEIGDAVRRVSRLSGWNDSEIGLSFVPVRPSDRGAEVTIGRIAVYRG